MAEKRGEHASGITGEIVLGLLSAARSPMERNRSLRRRWGGLSPLGCFAVEVWGTIEGNVLLSICLRAWVSPSTYDGCKGLAMASLCGEMPLG